MQQSGKPVSKNMLKAIAPGVLLHHALYGGYQAICCSTDALQGYALQGVPQWHPVRVTEIKIDCRFNSILRDELKQTFY